MRTLEALLRSYADGADARWWIGKRPDVRDSQLARAIAGLVGYPTARSDPFENDGIIRLDRAQAAHVLAVAGTTSLAYDPPSPSEASLAEAKAALKDFAGSATFLGNGHWNPGSPLGYSPLSAATFDCGVIGYDADNAFIFWVEEED
ncbi:hypothetical protein [Allosphingosinicella deserti]|uniref:Uncharacterized protein n=1 Tax=Allosphingosinicella deserti TaxID=2116704 RepID=A0A2P7QEA8_9SPHN|nr:hypothetical protein [Sphingomonas deserti]PSJ36266.1 hypothetical protein C7I55_27155 [Sphingomonas deserti]